MVWSRVERRRISQANPTMHNSDISKKLGNEWKNMPDDKKNYYVEEAKKLRAEHMLQNPDYKYKPRRRRNAVTNGANTFVNIPANLLSSVKIPQLIANATSISIKGNSSVVENLNLSAASTSNSNLQTINFVNSVDIQANETSGLISGDNETNNTSLEYSYTMDSNKLSAVAFNSQQLDLQQQQLLQQQQYLQLRQQTSDSISQNPNPYINNLLLMKNNEENGEKNQQEQQNMQNMQYQNYLMQLQQQGYFSGEVVLNEAKQDNNNNILKSQNYNLDKHQLEMQNIYSENMKNVQIIPENNEALSQHLMPPSHQMDPQQLTQQQIFNYPYYLQNNFNHSFTSQNQLQSIPPSENVAQHESYHGTHMNTNAVMPTSDSSYFERNDAINYSLSKD